MHGKRPPPRLMCWLLVPAGQTVPEGCGSFRGVALLKEGGHRGQALGFYGTVPLSVCSPLHDCKHAVISGFMLLLPRLIHHDGPHPVCLLRHDGLHPICLLATTNRIPHGYLYCVALSRHPGSLVKAPVGDICYQLWRQRRKRGEREKEHQGGEGRVMDTPICYAI